MKKYLILIISFFQYITNAQSNNCLKLFSTNNRSILISLKLEEDEMNNFKAEIKSINWKYIRADEILMYITLPDKKNQLSFDSSFPYFTQDKYSYFYPKTDYNYYLPNNFNSKLSYLTIDNEINVELDEFKNIVNYIKKDITSKINKHRFDYYFADKREEKYKSKTYGSGARIYNEKNEIVGNAHKFKGNLTISGHTDCDKMDYCRVTIDNLGEDKIYFFNMKDLKNNSILPIKEGKVFLRKIPIDLLRLEYCNLYLIMYEYAKKSNGAITFQLI
jgi:hypothetical protein